MKAPPSWVQTVWIVGIVVSFLISFGFVILRGYCRQSIGSMYDAGLAFSIVLSLSLLISFLILKYGHWEQ